MNKIDERFGAAHLEAIEPARGGVMWPRWWNPFPGPVLDIPAGSGGRIPSGPPFREGIF